MGTGLHQLGRSDVGAGLGGRELEAARCALIYLTRDEIEQSRVDPADLEELTSLPISIEGVKVG